MKNFKKSIILGITLAILIGLFIYERLSYNKYEKIDYEDIFKGGEHGR